MALRSLLTDNDTTEPMWPRLVAAEIALRERSIPMTGQTTPVPGLVITPSIAGDPARFTGGWRLAHAASGRLVVPGVNDVPIIYAEEAAQELATIVDWTAPAVQIMADATARQAVTALALDAGAAVADNRPIRWGRDSWVPAPTPGGSPARWQLRCAAPLCRDGLSPADYTPARLTDWDADEDEPYNVTGPRDRLSRLATEDHWHQYGERWLCPTCVAQHRTHEPPERDW